MAETGVGLGNLIKNREGIVETRRESTRGKNKLKKKGTEIKAIELGTWTCLRWRRVKKAKYTFCFRVVLHKF